MALRDPVPVYNTGVSYVAHLVGIALVNAGVEAFVSEGFPTEGGGVTAQVWVERADVERVKPILDDYERRAAELRDAGTQDEMQSEPKIEALCRNCAERVAFPSSQLGSVQQCPHCGAYIDVGEEDSPEDNGEFQGDDEVAENS